MALPRRYFNTESKDTTEDIIRDVSTLSTKVLDSNDVVGAEVIKQLADAVAGLGSAITSSKIIGLAAAYKVAFNTELD